MFKISGRKLRTNLHDLGKAVNVITTGRWIFYCMILGVFAGVIALVFSYLLDYVQQLVITDVTGIALPSPGGDTAGKLLPLSSGLESFFSLNIRWLILVVPALGGLLSGFIVFRYAPEAEGHGTDAVIRAFHHNQGKVRPKVPFIKLIASVLTIGTGGSAGKEGPIAQICGGVGSYFGTKLGLSVRERKILLMAGIGAGIGAIFKAPIGGAIFAAEVLYRSDFESEGLVASIIASIIGYSVYASIDGWEPIFTFAPVSFTNPYELPLFILLALVVMLVGLAYTKVFYGTKKMFDKLSIARHYKPMIAGFGVGAIGFFFPEILGSSYGFLQQALNGHMAISMMAAVMVLKIIATSLTIQSGGSGGVFGPSLVIGGFVGGLLGYGLEAIAPGLVTSPEAYILVGMASFFAGVANVPVTSTIMISEMSESYGLIVPLIFASAIAYLGSQSWSLYKEQLSNRLSSASYRDEFLNDVLENIKVRSGYQRIQNMPIIHHSTRVSEVLEEFTHSETLVLPVENDEQRIVGVISIHDVRELLRQDVGEIIIAADIMVPPKVLYLNEPMSKAFDIFMKTGLPEIPVLQHGTSRKFIGVLSERDFLLAYEKVMTSRKA